MKAFIFTAILSFLFYLLLTAGSGEVLLWSEHELVAGLALSVVVGFMTTRLISWEFSNKALDPRRWLLFCFYLVGPFLYQLTKANLDVAYRVVTGRVNPGIVKVKTGLKTDLATTLLANSITLTPGTLTVDLNDKNELFIHWIDVKDKKPRPEQVYGRLGYWIKRVME